MKPCLAIAIGLIVAPALNYGWAQDRDDKHRFENPRINGRPVDRCLNWAANCERPAADNFCRVHGFRRAEYYRFAPMRPTLVVGDDRICNQEGCTGFTEIVCEGRGAEYLERREPVRFELPRIRGQAVDRCLNFATNCEQPAADNFCRMNGFRKAEVFRFAPMRPTLVVGDDQLCNQEGCQGFTTIVCR